MGVCVRRCHNTQSVCVCSCCFLFRHFKWFEWFGDSFIPKSRSNHQDCVAFLTARKYFFFGVTKITIFLYFFHLVAIAWDLFFLVFKFTHHSIVWVYLSNSSVWKFCATQLFHDLFLFLCFQFCIEKFAKCSFSLKNRR